jgi:hypothetical protein
MNAKTENNTINAATMLFGFISEMTQADKFEQLRFNATEKSDQWLQLLRKQFATVQHGNSKGKPKAGELPNALVKSETQRLYDSLKKAAVLENREFKCSYETFYTEQHKLISFYLRTGKVKNRAKTTLIADALEQQSKFEKQLVVDQAKLDKAKQAADKAAADKAAADAQAAQAAAESEQVIEDICTIIDDDPQGASAVQSDLLGVIDDAQAAQAAADAQAAQAAADKVQADKVQVQAQAAADKTKKELDKVKAKLATLSAPKAENNKSEPKLDFKVLNFSQDCKDTASMILEGLEREATSAPELLYLAKLILDKYNK